jgi:hypothetical protein
VCRLVLLQWLNCSTGLWLFKRLFGQILQIFHIRPFLRASARTASSPAHHSRRPLILLRRLPSSFPAPPAPNSSFPPAEHGRLIPREVFLHEAPARSAHRLSQCDTAPGGIAIDWTVLLFGSQREFPRRDAVRIPHRREVTTNVWFCFPDNRQSVRAGVEFVGAETVATVRHSSANCFPRNSSNSGGN